MQKRFRLFALSAITLACSTVSLAAKPVDLRHESINTLNSLTSFATFKELNKHTDFNGTTHTRVQQMYDGYAVWGGDAIIHTDKQQSKTANGIIYQDIKADLSATPQYALTEKQAGLALEHATRSYAKKSGFTKHDLSHAKTTRIVYIDKQNKAHWAYHVTFLSGSENGMPVVPTYILDATSFAVYAEWNNLQTLEDVKGGGYGGNEKTGKFTYDGIGFNLPSFKITRDAAKKLCTLAADDIEVKDDTNASGPFSNSPTASFTCDARDAEHNNLYWNGDLDQTNGGFSPVNDALYIGNMIKDMYKKWYNVPALSIFGYPMPIILHAHAKDLYGNPMDNAFFLSLTMQMYFGDGVEYFYPLTSLGVGAHEISHGFTSQHSNLTYEKQSGGLNESYSDMAAQAAEYYASGTNSWQIGPEIVKGEGALRYMDDPTKDGKSIAHIRDYNDELNVHYTSGIFNKVFYTLGTSKGWDTRKAFDVMVKANMDYWTNNSTFEDAACGVVSATKDNHYPLTAVKRAFKKVGIDVSSC